MQFDWSRSFRKRRSNFDKYSDPETGTTYTIFLTILSKILGIAINFKINDSAGIIRNERGIGQNICHDKTFHNSDQLL